MALKAILDKIDDLPEDVKKEYKQVDGKFHLDVADIDNHPAVGALKRSMDLAKSERGTAQTALATAQADLLKVRDELDELHRGAVPKGDVTKLEDSWKKKLLDKETELTGRIKKLEGTVDKSVRQDAASKLAADIFLSPTLGLPHVLPRLAVAEEGEEFIIKVLDAKGAPSALTLDELKKEILQNKELAPILRGTRASGGGAGGGTGGGGAPSDDGKPFDAAKASPKDLAARIKEKKAAEGG